MSDDSVGSQPVAASSSNPKSRKGKGGKFLDKEEAALFKHMKRQIRKMELEHKESIRQLKKQLKTTNSILENTLTLARQVEASGKEQFERAEKLQKEVETLTAERDKLKGGLEAKESELRIQIDRNVDLQRSNVDLDEKLKASMIAHACTKATRKEEIELATAELTDRINDLQSDLANAKRGWGSDTGSEPDMNQHTAPEDQSISINMLSLALGNVALTSAEEVVERATHMFADSLRLGKKTAEMQFIAQCLVDTATLFDDVLMNITTATRDEDLLEITLFTCFGMRGINKKARKDKHDYMKSPKASRVDYVAVQECAKACAAHSVNKIKAILSTDNQSLCEMISFVHRVMGGDGVSTYDKVRNALRSPIAFASTVSTGSSDTGLSSNTPVASPIRPQAGSSSSSTSTPLVPSSPSGKAPLYVPRQPSRSAKDALSAFGGKKVILFAAGDRNQTLRFVLHKPISVFAKPVNVRTDEFERATCALVYTNQPVDARGEIVFHGANRKFPGRLVDLTEVLTAEFVDRPGRDKIKLCTELHTDLSAYWERADGEKKQHVFCINHPPSAGTTDQWLEKLWANVNARVCLPDNGGTAMNVAEIKTCARNAFQYGQLRQLPYQFWYMDKGIGAEDGSDGMRCIMPPYGGIWAVNVLPPES